MLSSIPFDPPRLSAPALRYYRQVRRCLCLPGKARKEALHDLSRELLQLQDQDYLFISSQLGAPEDLARSLNRCEPGYEYIRSPWRYPLLVIGLAGLVGTGYFLATHFLTRYFLNNPWSFLTKEPSIGIIGGADGPTAIFLTASPLLGRFWCLFPTVVVAVLGFLCYYILGHYKHRL